MKVLLISHNVLSKTNNMGKTLLGYTEKFDINEVAQFYIHSEVPTDNTVCINYYRFTDFDAVKALVNPWHDGRVFYENDIDLTRLEARVDSGVATRIYVKGSNHGALMMLMRELVWKVTRWNTKKLRDWITEVSPDVIFFASGDYGFMYRIASKISDMTGKPLVLACVDDYYFHNRNADSLLGRLAYKSYMNTVRKTMSKTKRIFTICDNMARSYEQLFGIPCEVLHTGAENKVLELDLRADKISYIGNLGLNRYKQLIDISCALGNIDGGYIDVYSGERNPEYTEPLKKAPNIRFHGAISADEVLEVMRKSKVVIHTESFDEDMKLLTRYSVSTKIAESLMYGPCLLAYGPEGIASVDYLKENGAAYVITSKDDLEDGLRELMTDFQLRKDIVKRARALAVKNHDSAVNSANIRKWLEEVCEECKHEGAVC